MREPQGVAIRIATVEDAERLSRFAARTFWETFAADNTAEDMATYCEATFSPELQRAELADRGVRVLLAEHDDALIAYGQLASPAAHPALAAHPAPPCVTAPAPIELVRFYVDRAAHGRGVAQALMRRIVDEAARMGGAVLWLGVWERNPRAIAFYRKMGFEDVGSHEFVLGSDVQTDRIMQRPLGPASAG